VTFVRFSYTLPTVTTAELAMRDATVVLILDTFRNRFLGGYQMRGPQGFKGRIMLPGGKRERSQTLLTCALTETFDETGVSIDARYTAKVGEFISYLSDVPQYKVHVFRTLRFDGEPRQTAEFSPEWFSSLRPPHEQMFPSDVFWFSAAVSDIPFTADIYFDTTYDVLKNICIRRVPRSSFS
jgi:8-oxo-dGTP pyrophosphatase MutT (NUDIX family)